VAPKQKGVIDSNELELDAASWPRPSLRSKTDC